MKDKTIVAGLLTIAISILSIMISLYNGGYSKGYMAGMKFQEAITPTCMHERETMKLKIEIGPYNTEAQANEAMKKLIDNYHPYAYDTSVKVELKNDQKYWVVGSRNKTAE